MNKIYRCEHCMRIYNQKNEMINQCAKSGHVVEIYSVLTVKVINKKDLYIRRAKSGEVK